MIMRADWAFSRAEFLGAETPIMSSERRFPAIDSETQATCLALVIRLTLSGPTGAMCTGGAASMMLHCSCLSNMALR